MIFSIGFEVMKLIVNEAEINIPGKRATINDLLKEIGTNRESVVVAVNGEIKIEEEALTEGDVVKLISAVSGG
jgi:thiamine biosynthesis protein ThiS